MLDSGCADAEARPKATSPSIKAHKPIEFLKFAFWMFFGLATLEFLTGMGLQ